MISCARRGNRKLVEVPYSPGRFGLFNCLPCRRAAVELHDGLTNNLARRAEFPGRLKFHLDAVFKSRAMLGDLDGRGQRPGACKISAWDTIGPEPLRGHDMGEAFHLRLEVGLKSTPRPGCGVRRRAGHRISTHHSE